MAIVRTRVFKVHVTQGNQAPLSLIFVNVPSKKELAETIGLVSTGKDPDADFKSMVDVVQAADFSVIDALEKSAVNEARVAVTFAGVAIGEILVEGVTAYARKKAPPTKKKVAATTETAGAK